MASFLDSLLFILDPFNLTGFRDEKETSQEEENPQVSLTGSFLKIWDEYDDDDDDTSRLFIFY